MSQDDSLEEFGGAVRLFPLPNLVLFPGAVQPLHIFEPRYRQLMADALEDDRLIAMALLRPGWEESYHGRPPIHPVVCVGRILQEERLADGRYNLLLRGLSRARVREEPATDKLYRVARVDLLDDVPVSSGEEEARLRGLLREGVAGWFADEPAAQEQVARVLAGDLPLGRLCDLFAFALPLEVEARQALLEETSVPARVRRLLGLVGAKARRFPPEPSAN